MLKSAALAIIALGLHPSLATGTGYPAVTAAEMAENATELERILGKPPGDYLIERPYDLPLTSRSLAIPLSGYRNAATGPIRASALRRDLPWLRAWFEKNYMGWDVFREKGLDWDDWFGKWDRLLESHGESELEWSVAFSPWFELLRRFPDSWSGPRPLPAELGNYSRTAWLGSVPAEACDEVRNDEGSAFRLDVLDRNQQPQQVPAFREDGSRILGAYLSYPSLMGTLAGARCGSAWIPVRPAPVLTLEQRLALIAETSLADPTLASSRMLQEGTRYVRMPSILTSEATHSYRQLAESLQAAHAGTESVVVLDLRSHAGGYDDAEDEIIRTWIRDWDPKLSFGAGNRHKNSCVTGASSMGAALSGLATLATAPPVYLMWFDWAKDLMLASYAPDCPVSFESTPAADWGYEDRVFRPRPGQARVLALVDDKTGGDAESLLARLARSPQVLVAGVNTVGAQLAFEGTAILPFSRVKFRIAMSEFRKFRDPLASTGARGLPVDAYLGLAASRPRQALESLVKWFESGAAGAGQ
jgi:hypothetical protein